MNKQIFSNHTAKAILALLAVSTIGLVTSPAKADDALIQETVQRSVTTGSNNLSVQTSRQNNRQVNINGGRYGHGKDNNTGIVQRTDQSCDQYGEFNTCVQDARQNNISHSRNVHRRR
ncbi:MAG: hypothetical protein Tsb0014_46290 [Pleurocapsa sp.]